MNWLHYLLEANLYLGIFYLCYCLFLNKETHYMLNRIYLISTCIVSFIIPIVQLGILKPDEPALQNVIFTAPSNIPRATMPVHTFTAAVHFNPDEFILYIYMLGAITLLVIFTIKIYHVLKLIHTKPVVLEDRYKLIYINGSNTAFSFFSYLFIGANTPGSGTIIRHELVHIRQKHSLDIILLEIVKIINWFNPLVYLLQNSLRNVHEYIADQETVAFERDFIAYASFLVNNAYGISGSPITHSFYNYKLLKNRIIMLNQKPSGSLARLKYLIAAPVCVGLLCISTLVFSKSYGWVDLIPNKSAGVVNNQKETSKSSLYASLDVKSKREPLMKLRPPVVVKNSYTDFYNYICKTIAYPQKAKNEHVEGTVIVSFKIGNNKTIQDVTIFKSAGHGFDEAAAKAVKSYNKPIDINVGYHKMPVRFRLP